MKSLVRFALVQLIVLFFVSAMAAQKPTPTPTPTPSSTVDDVSRTFEVRLPVTVKNKDKGLVLCTDKKASTDGSKTKKGEVEARCFTKDDFIVLEDGVPQQITSFSDEATNPPLFVGVLMDTSPSTAGKIKFSKEAAKNFIYTVTKVRKDKAAFMTFDHEINLLQDFTDKLDLLDRAVDKVNRVGSQTALYDAIWQFADEKLRSVPGRRVIVLITDGDDTFSRADINDAIDIAQRTETTIFAISTKEGFLGSVPGVEAGTVKDQGDKMLDRLCSETGGESFYSGDMLALERALNKVARELQGQYIITYKPANQDYDGRKRKIEVQFKDKENTNKYKLRSKTEYRAVKDTLK
ncbi:MAG: VWA domain-containing protein [Acidobacteria bacterium]|nr:VWA domain-containing protein [Acidobacteriota bacterium]